MSSLDGSLIKKAHQLESFTQDQLTEFAKCADPVSGPAYFMESYFHIQHPIQGKLLYAPYEYQTRLIDTYHSNRFSISLMPRQTGKCCSYNTTIINKSNNTLADIGDLIWPELTVKQKIVTKLENWLVLLAIN